MDEIDTDASFDNEETYGLSDDIARSLVTALEIDDHALVAELLANLHPADIALFISTVTAESRIKLIEMLRPNFNPEILVALDTTVRAAVIAQLGAEDSAAALTKLDTEDAVYVIEDLPSLAREAILVSIPEEERHALQDSLAYPENSAGRIMQKKLVSVPEYWTVGQTIDYLRQNNELPDEFYEVYVVDPKHRPVGSILVSKIMRNQRSVVINDIMQTEIKILNTDLDQEEVSFLFSQYALTSAPVVNKDGRLVGLVSINDIVEIIEEEAEEDIMRMGGVTETDLHAAFFQTARHRFPWLFVNVATAFIASMVIGLFQGSIQNMVALATLMPIVASMGGNAGTQTLTVIVRAIATKELSPINSFRIIGKECLAGSLNGLFFALLTGIAITLWHHNLQLSMVFAAAIIINLTMAGLAGTVIPLVLNRMGIDPAIASSVFLTAITDTVGFFSFLGLATWLLL